MTALSTTKTNIISCQRCRFYADTRFSNKNENFDNHFSLFGGAVFKTKETALRDTFLGHIILYLGCRHSQKK